MNVRETAEYVTLFAQNVQINSEAIKTFAQSITKKELVETSVVHFRHSWGLGQIIPIICTFNVANFCFWAAKGEPKWSVRIGKETYSGSTALFYALEEEFRINDHFRTTGPFLEELNARSLGRILNGNTEIPLFKERLQLLNEAGEVLNRKYRGSWFTFFCDASADAIQMAELLIRDFPGFRDTSIFLGYKVSFHKRAQLNSKMIHDALVTQGMSPLKNLDGLTVFADYRLPQILHQLNILQYSDALRQKIENYEEIPRGSAEEIEIRASTVWACELISNALKHRFNWTTVSHVDSLLWHLARARCNDDIMPYHRTRTTAY